MLCCVVLCCVVLCCVVLCCVVLCCVVCLLFQQWQLQVAPLVWLINQCAIYLPQWTCGKTNYLIPDYCCGLLGLLHPLLESTTYTAGVGWRLAEGFSVTPCCQLYNVSSHLQLHSFTHKSIFSSTDSTRSTVRYTAAVISLVYLPDTTIYFDNLLQRQCLLFTKYRWTVHPGVQKFMRHSFS